MLFFLLALLLILILIGAPVFVAMGGAALLHYFDTGRDSTLMILTARLFGSLTSFTFLAIPMFLLAGELMLRGGLVDRLIRLARALVGNLRGSLAQINIMASVLFAGISGSAHADVAAMGSVFIPAMKDEGYKPGFAGAVTAASGTLSPMFPPSIVLVVYGSVFNVSIAALFAAGLAVAALMALSFFIVVWVAARKLEVPTYGRADAKEFWAAARGAILSVGMPVIIAVGIFGGVFTATEAAAIAAAYALVVTMFIYRSIKWNELGSILQATARTTAAIAILIGVSGMFSYVIARRDIPGQTVELLLSVVQSNMGITLTLFAFMLIAGMFVDRTSAILLLGPILIPLFKTLGYGDVQIAMIIVMALGIGHLTPPVGGTLLTTSLVGKVSVVAITRYMWPFILVQILLTLAVLYFPAISEALPRYWGLGGL